MPQVREDTTMADPDVDVMAFAKEENAGSELAPAAEPQQKLHTGKGKKKKPAIRMAKEKRLIIRIKTVGPMLTVGATGDKGKLGRTTIVNMAVTTVHSAQRMAQILSRK
jgi:hypothetical protein